MLLRILLLSLTAVLALTSCARNTPSVAKASVNSSSDSGAKNETLITLTEAEDPDRDGDAKGYTYFPMERSPTGSKVFIFDPNYGAWAVYDEKGERVNVGRASGGKSFCPDIGRPCETVAGTFTIIRKRGADCKSNIYPLETKGGAPMPYCMNFEAKGYAIHGSHHVPDYNASHGCVRVNPVAAKWLSESFLQIGSTVIVLPYHPATKNVVASS